MAGDNRTVKVTLKAEIANYVANMLRSAKATSDLGKNAQQASSEIAQAMAQAEKATEANSQTFTRWGTTAKRSLAAVTLAAGAFFSALAVQGVNANSFAEQNQIALTTMLGDAKAAKSALDDVYGLATETPFQFPVLTEQYKTFVATRMSLETIMPLMHAYSASVAALGGDTVKLDLVADAFSKIATLGKADAELLNSLALNGIPAWQMLADAAGSSVESVRNDVSAGMYDAERTIAILTTGMEKQFGGMLEGMGDSYARWKDRLGSSQRRTAQELSTPIMDVGKEVMKSLVEVFNASTAALKGVDWGPVIEPLMRIPEIFAEIASEISGGGTQQVINGVGRALALAAETGEALYRVAVPLIQILSMSSLPVADVLTGLLQGFNALPGPIQASLTALAMFVALNKTAFGAQVVSQVTTFATTLRATIAEQIRYQQTLATGSFLNGQAALSTTRLSLAWGAAKTSALGLATAARGAGTALMAAFGGPVGLAIAGTFAIATLAMSAFTDAQQKAEALAQRQATAIDSVTAALDRNTGALGENARAAISSILDDAGIPEALRGIGVGLDEFSDALYGNGEAQDAFRSNLQAMLDSDQKLQDATTPLPWETREQAIEKMTARIVEAGGEIDKLDSKDPLRRLPETTVQAMYALGIFNQQVGNNESSLRSFADQAELAGEAANIEGAVNVDTQAAQSRLEGLIATARKALASFIDLSPSIATKPKSKGGGGGGGGESAAAKAAKAEQAAIKKQADAEKKAANDYEKLMRDRARAATDAANEAEKAAREAASAEEEALDKSKRAIDNYVSAQRQRQAIERTLAAENDPVRRAQLQQALADAIRHEAEMLRNKTDAELAAAQATAGNTAAQQNATSATQQASVAQTEYEASAARAAAVQEEAAAKIEAAAERLAAATEDSAGRAGGAVSDFSEEAVFNLQEYMNALEAQVLAQEKWRDNMLTLSGQVSSSTLQTLMEMGSGGAQIVQSMVDANGEDLARMDDLFTRSGADIASQFGSDMDRLGVLIPEITKRFGSKAADNLKEEYRKGRVSVDQIMSALNASWDGKRMTLNIDARTQDAINQTGGLMDYISSLRPTIRIGVYGEVYVNGKPRGYMAKGGAVDGSGPKGVDSVPIMAAPGEHMWTADEVDAVGGQDAMYRLRALALAGKLTGDEGSTSGHPPDISRAINHGGGSGGGTVIYQTLYYPQAEPSSKAAINAVRNEVG